MGNSAFEAKAGPESAVAGAVYVSTDGNDSNEGTLAYPFLTLKAALASITDNDSDHPRVIKMGPGVFAEDNPLVCKEYVDIACMGDSYTTIIAASNVGSNILQGAANMGITNIVVAGATGAAGIAMLVAGQCKMEGVAISACDAGVLCNHADAELFINYFGIDAYTYTNVLKCTAGTITADALRILDGVEADEAVYASGSGAQVILFNPLFKSTDIDDAVFLDDGAEVLAFGGDIEGCDIAFHIGNTGTGSNLSVRGCRIKDTTTQDLLNESATATIHAFNTDTSRSKVSSAAGADEAKSGWDRDTEVYRYMAPVEVGSDREGHSMSIGTGGPYTYSTVAKTYNGSVYADYAGGVLQFPNVTAGTMLYFGDTDQFSFSGGVYTMGDTKINLGTGSIVWEYYDGGASAWVAFNVQDSKRGYSTLATPPNLPFQWDEGVDGSIRFDCALLNSGVPESNPAATGWVANTVDGVEAKWIRVRIVSAITTSPKFTPVGWKGNYTKIRDNGSQAFNGSARPVLSRQSEAGWFEGSAANQSLDISASLDAWPFKENSLNNGANDFLYFRFLLPETIDLSCGVSIEFELCSDSAPSGADETAKLHLISCLLPVGAVFDGTNAEVIQDFDFVVPDGTAAYTSQRIELDDRIDVSEALPGYSLYMSLHRENNEAGDDLAGKVIESQLIVKYTDWQNGAFNE